MKKMIALLLALVMLLALSACGTKIPAGETRTNAEIPEVTPEPTPEPETFATRIARAQKLMQDADSFHMDMNMVMAMGMELMGENMDIDVTVNYDIDSIKAPLQMKMEMQMVMSMMGQTQNQDAIFYAVQDGDAYTTYASMDNGRTWEKATKDSIDEVEQQQKAEEQMELFLACADSFEETGRETVNGAEAVVYKGKISGDYVKQAVENSGSLDSLAGLTGDAEDDSLFEDLGDLDVTIAFDAQNGYILYYEMDMTATLNVLMDRLMEKALSAQGLDVTVTVNMSQAFARVELSQYNAINTFEIPEAALAA